ncbi:MAG: hypothetical protein ACOX6T_02075 [Myxococcales bacterium]|jgi:hypothetical protein
MTSNRQGRQVPSCRALLLVAALLGTISGCTPGGPDDGEVAVLVGRVEAGGVGLAGSKVSLFASEPQEGCWALLGSDIANRRGEFRIVYSMPPDTPLLFVEAERGPAMLASAIGSADSAPRGVVVNERTTVATANAFAQFIRGRRIDGNAVGMANAARMAANLADPVTGRVGVVLASTPNGTETSTLATFNSLSNVVLGCVADERNCERLFDATTPAGRPAPRDVLEALANLVKSPAYPGFPSNVDDPIFLLSLRTPLHQPALAQRPTSWLLFLKITGGFFSAQDSDNLMNGPGNFAIDEEGFVWINDNYVPRPPDQFACAGRRLIKLFPWGAPVLGTPFFGGGLSGAGFGITLDPRGHVWVGNFGFQDPPCALLPEAATNDSVSEFLPDGTPVSPPRGYTQGDVSWPQGTVSDRRGNIWIANCGNDTVTVYPDGKPKRAVNLALGPTPPAGQPQIKPFGVTTDLEGNAWVTGNASDTVSIISPAGGLLKTLPSSFHGKTVLSHPLGIAADSRGNVWVANSDWLDVPCPTPAALGSAENPSITLFEAETKEPHPGSPFTGGGLTVPWGIAIDGDDTVWVFNFGAVPVLRRTDVPTGISRFCGVNTARCPAGMRVGEPISPETGYRSDAIERITGGQIDPSGNIWLTNNWKIDANPVRNPGGNAVVIAIGAAGPIKTPLIGPPRSFEAPHGRCEAYQPFPRPREACTRFGARKCPGE